MAPIRVQQASTYSAGANLLSITATFPSPLTPGNTIIAIYKDNSTTSIITLPANWAWVGGNTYNSGTSRQIGIAYKVVQSTDTTAVTFTSSYDLSSKALAVVEVSGISAPSAPIYSGVSSAVTSKTLASTGVLDKAESYVLAVCDQSATNGSTIGSWTNLSVTDTFVLRHGNFCDLIMIADNITSTTDALTPTFTWITARQSIGMTAVFPGGTPPVDESLPDVYVKNVSGVWVAHTIGFA